MINLFSRELKFKLSFLCILPYILFYFLVYHLDNTEYISYLIKVYFILLKSTIGAS